MTDIIERLRNRALAAAIIKDKPDLYNDAADAIIRLCEENEKLRRDVKTAIMGDSAELQDVKRENEKLRAALKPFAGYVEQPERIYEHEGVRMTLVNQDVLMRLCQAAAAAIRESGDE